MNSQGYGERMVQLHRRYGPVVRMGPDRVSVSDPAAVHVTHGTRPVWEKAPSYRASAPFGGGKAIPSVVSMTETQSSAVHKVASATFTSHALLDYEDQVDQSCAALLRALQSPTGEVDLSRWFALFTMDVINRIAFSDSLGFLDAGEDIQGLIAGSKDRFDHWGRWGAMPGLDYLLFKSPFARVWKRQKRSPLAEAARMKMDERELKAEQKALPEKQDLLGKFLSGTAKHPGLVTSSMIIGMVQSTIGAGADTTAATLSVLFYYLDRHPEVAEKLRQELFAAQLSSPPRWDEVRSLPYLEAVIKEAMRILPVAQWGQDRVVPEGGAVIAGKHIPAGTVVGLHIDSIQRNADVFGADADNFRPERWILAKEEQRARMERAMLGFGAGKRICLGMHIAWLEMKKLVPLLVLQLDISYHA